MSRLSVGQIEGLTSNSNVITIPSGHTIKQPGGIIQIVQTTKLDSFATSPGALWADIPGMSVSITPKFNTSKILVMVDLKMAADTDASTVRSRLLRDATAIYIGTPVGSRSGALSEFYMTSAAGPYYVAQGGGTFLDSPSTTSALTYKVQIGGDNNGSICYVNRTEGDRDTAYYDARTSSSITVIEVMQ